MLCTILIDSSFVERCGILVVEFEGLQVQVVDGYTLKCNKTVKFFSLMLE